MHLSTNVRVKVENLYKTFTKIFLSLTTNELSFFFLYKNTRNYLHIDNRKKSLSS